MSLFNEIFAIQNSATSLGQEMVSGMQEIITAPLRDPSILWLILPLISLWLLMEIYMGRRKQEKLGWNTALGNGITLFWVGLGLARFLFSTKPDFFILKIIMATGLICYGMLIMLVTFKHELSEKLAFTLAAPSAIYYPAIMITLWSYGVLSLTRGTIIDIILIYPVILLVWFIIKHGENDAIDSSMDSLDSASNMKMPDLGGNLSSGDMSPKRLK